jgi:hypothetical protein
MKLPLAHRVIILNVLMIVEDYIKMEGWNNELKLDDLYCSGGDSE